MLVETDGKVFLELNFFDVNLTGRKFREKKAKAPDYIGALIYSFLAVFMWWLSNFADHSRKAYMDTHHTSSEGLCLIARYLGQQLGRDYQDSFQGEVQCDGNLIWFLSKVDPKTGELSSQAKSNIVYSFAPESLGESACGKCDKLSYYSRAVLPLLPNQETSLSSNEVHALIQETNCFEHERGYENHTFGNPKWPIPLEYDQRNVRYQLSKSKNKDDVLTLEIKLAPRYSSFWGDITDKRPSKEQLKTTITMPGGFRVEKNRGL